MTGDLTLSQLQRIFSRSLLAEDAPPVATAGVRRQALGHRVHTQNARGSLRRALEDDFPITRRLVGCNFFAEMAGRFVAAHPPKHGWLSGYGDGFPDFVAQYPAAADLVYLSDLARIEWACLLAANSPNGPSLDVTVLADFGPEELEGLLLNLHGAASLVRSRFPVYDIWLAHQRSVKDEDLATIDLGKGAQDVLVSRSGQLDVGVALVGEGDAAILAAIAAGASFAAACQAALFAEADYDLGSSFGNLVCMRALAALC
jgi:hypothetical protein